jgi:predicted dehydrogenase
MDSLRVGLIGCGHIGTFHSRNLRGVVRSELLPLEYVAVSDRLPERAGQFAALTGAEVVARTSDLLDLPGLGAVYVCTETAEHPALVVAAAERGLAVFCEKPLATNLASVEEMVRAVSMAGVTNQVGLVLRSSPVFTVLKGMFEETHLGPLLSAHLRDDQFFPIRGHYNSTWRGELAKAGGGTLLEHSIHDVDLFRWLFGEISAVRCHTRNTAGYKGIEDVALVTFQHTAGHQTSLTSIWHAVDERPSSRRLEVFFEGGWFVTDHDFLGPITYQLRSGPERTLTADEVFERYVALMRLGDAEARLARAGMYADYLFLKSTIEGQPAFPDFSTAHAAHRVLAACYASAASNSEVQLDV